MDLNEENVSWIIQNLMDRECPFGEIAEEHAYSDYGVFSYGLINFGGIIRVKQYHLMIGENYAEFNGLEQLIKWVNAKEDKGIMWADYDKLKKIPDDMTAFEFNLTNTELLQFIDESDDCVDALNGNL